MDMYPKTVLQFNPMAPYLSLLKALSKAVPSVLGVDTVQDREPWHSSFAMPAAVSRNEAWFLPRTLTTARAGQKASLLSAASMKPFLDRKRRERKEREGKRASVNKKERKKERGRERRERLTHSQTRCRRTPRNPEGSPAELAWRTPHLAWCRGPL